MEKDIKIDEPEMVKCENCDGDGWRFHESNSAYTRPCYQCNETGQVIKTKTK